MKNRILALLLCLSVLFAPLLATACAVKQEVAPEQRNENTDQSSDPSDQVPVPDGKTTEDPDPTDLTPDDPTPDDPTPDDPTPDDPTPDDPTPDDPTPDDPTPDDPTPDDPTPEDPEPVDPAINAERYQKIGRAAEKTAQTVAGAQTESPFLQALRNAAANGWIELSVTENPAAEEPQPDLYVKIRLQEAAGALEFSAGEGEDAVDAAVWYDLSNAVAVGSRALLGGTYGVSMQTLPFLILQMVPAEVWENEQLGQIVSAIAAMLVSGNGLDLGSLISGEPDEPGEPGEADPDEPGEFDIEPALSSAFEELVAFAQEYLEIAESQEQTTSLGAKIAATRLTLTLTKSDFSDQLDPLYELIENSDDLNAALEKVYPYLPEVLKLLQNSPVAGMIPELDIPENPEDLVTVSPEQLTALLDVIKSLLSNITGDFSIFLNENEEIVRVEAAIRIQGIPITVVLELGATPGTEFALSVQLPLLGNLVSLSNRKTATGRKISLEYNGFVIPNSDILRAVYELTIPEAYGTAVFTRTVMKTGEGYLPETETTRATITYQEKDGLQVVSDLTLTVNGKAVPLPIVQITVCETDDPLSEIPEYTDLFWMTTEEREALWEQAKAKIAELIPALEPEDE